MTDNFESSIVAIFNTLISNMHSSMPGRIVSFDRDKQLCAVMPCLKRKFIGQDAINLPLIEDVPVMFPGSGDFWITWDVKKDSYCLLIFSERSIANWLNSGGIVDPLSKRKFNLSDCFAFVGVNPLPDKLSTIDADSIVIRNRANSSFIKLDSSGQVNINGHFTVDS